MAGFVSGDSSNHGSFDGGYSKSSKDKQHEALGSWYVSRTEIEENSPSRKDGIDLKKENFLRKSYCTYLQDLGMTLKVPQITIATAVVFCHRFFLRQSHAKNDRRTIATVCMFLAGKVEETPHPLREVIVVSYELIHEKDPAAAQRIKQKEVYEQQKELILLGERVVLATLAFDLNIQHPYKPLVDAMKRFNVAEKALVQVAWNFVNDGLRTWLCVQFKPHHVAAGAIFLAAKFLRVKLPSDGEKVWWQEFDVTPRQLEEVSNQMLELYEQNGVPLSQGSEVEGSAAGGGANRAAAKAPAVNEEQPSRQISFHTPQHSSAENDDVPQGGTENQSNDGSAEMGSVITDHKADVEIGDSQHSGELHQKDKRERKVGADQDTKGGRKEGAKIERRDVVGRNLEGKVGQEAIKMIDKEKVKAALEKRKKARVEMTLKKDVIDEDDLIERELEDGVELAVEDEKTKRARRQRYTGHVESEEGEMIDDASSFSNSRKRKMNSPADG